MLFGKILFFVDQVSKDIFMRFERLCGFHMEVYAQGIEPTRPSARALAEKILEDKVETGFVVRDVYRPP